MTANSETAAPTQGADNFHMTPLQLRILADSGSVPAMQKALRVVADQLQGADARPVAITELERKTVAKSVFGGINALRWILNITTEFDRKDVRTRQAARLLDDHCTGEGTTNRAHLEHLWKTLNDALSLEDTLACLATRDAAVAPADDARPVAFEEWATKEGLIAKSHGLLSVSSSCDVARKAWNAALATRCDAPQTTPSASMPVQITAQNFDSRFAFCKHYTGIKDDTDEKQCLCVGNRECGSWCARDVCPLLATRDAAPSDAQDAERYRWAIALEDNAETLYAEVVNNAPDKEAIGAAIDSARAASAPGKKTS